ncbi:MAG: nitroreductase family protein [Dysgonamonadaceae bacterium]|jgi:nitroreductase|nr:nitroreductase family protein [Dysgonamonadaceae bacterium]
MNLDEIIAKRKSVRKYTEQVVDEQTIKALIESARLAPSAVNFQPWTFIVCRSEEAKQIVRDSYPRDWFNTAPIYIIVCGNHSQSWKRPADGKDHCDIDIAIATEHIALKSVELGLGTCWVCNFNPEIIKNGLRLPEDIEPVVLLPIGYVTEDYEADPRNKNRKSPDEITEWM